MTTRYEAPGGGRWHEDDELPARTVWLPDIDIEGTRGEFREGRADVPEILEEASEATGGASDALAGIARMATSPGGLISGLRDLTYATAAATAATRGNLDQRDEIIREHRANPVAQATGALDALTFGHTDELAGAASALGQGISEGTLARGFGDNYEQARDRVREATQEASEGDLRNYIGGNLAGAAATGQLVNPLTSFARPGLERGLLAAAEGGIQGALENIGNAEEGSGLSWQMDEALGMPSHLAPSVPALTSALASGGMQSGFDFASTMGTVDPDALMDRASLLRLRALFGRERPSRSDFRKLAGVRRGRPERARQTVDELREMGVTRADQAPDMLDDVGDDLADVARQLDLEGAHVDANEIARRIRAQGATLERERGIGPEALRGFEDEALRWERAVEGGDPMNFSRAWQFRQEMGRPEYWAVGPGGMNPASAYRRDVYDVVRDQMQDAANIPIARGGPGDPYRTGATAATDLGQRWREGNRRFSLLADVARASDEADLRDVQNRQFSLTDTILAGGAAAHGDPTMAVLALGGNRLLRGREHAMKASVLEIAARLARDRRGGLEGWRPTLQAAMARGPQAFSGVVFRLMSTEPDFRQSVQEAQSGDLDDLWERGEPIDDDPNDPAFEALWDSGEPVQ